MCFHGREVSACWGYELEDHHWKPPAVISEPSTESHPESIEGSCRCVNIPASADLRMTGPYPLAAPLSSLVMSRDDGRAPDWKLPSSREAQVHTCG